MVAMGATTIYKTHSLEDKQLRAWLVSGWVTQPSKQRRLGSCAHAGYH